MAVELRNLVVLSFASNTCYTEVKRADDLRDENLQIDTAKGLWSYSPWKDVRVGHARFVDNCSRYGVIGVYDSSDVMHLDTMVHDAMETVDRHAIDVD